MLVDCEIKRPQARETQVHASYCEFWSFRAGSMIMELVMVTIWAAVAAVGAEVMVDTVALVMDGTSWEQ